MIWVLTEDRGRYTNYRDEQEYIIEDKDNPFYNSQIIVAKIDYVSQFLWWTNVVEVPIFTISRDYGGWYHYETGRALNDQRIEEQRRAYLIKQTLESLKGGDND